MKNKKDKIYNRLLLLVTLFFVMLLLGLVVLGGMKIFSIGARRIEDVQRAECQKWKNREDKSPMHYWTLEQAKQCKKFGIEPDTPVIDAQDN